MLTIEFGTVITEIHYKKGEKIKMKRVKFFQILILALYCCFVVSYVHATPMVSLQPSPIDIFEGDIFQINVVADGVTDVDLLGPDEVIAFGFDLDYNPVEFTLLNTEVNSDLFFDDSAFIPNTEVAGSAFPGVTGNSILLATMTFNTLGLEGSYRIGISSDLSDVNEGLITVIHGPVNITSLVTINVAKVPVPEPSTILLFGVGLIGLVGRNRRS